MKRNDDDLRAELLAHLQFLAEAGADFVMIRPEEMSSPAIGRPSPDPSFVSDADRSSRSVSDEEAFRAIEQQVLECRLCSLHRMRNRAVPGEGYRKADLIFIGEAPGRDEDLQGRPFVGRAGKLLRRIIAAMQYREEEVYITNVVKCRPPENRTPHQDEVRACSPYLVRQIELIKPRVIVTLGRSPTNFFIDSKKAMSALRGRFGSYRDIPVMPTFHPSYLVRNEGNRDLKRMVWEDMKKVMAYLGKK